jgi:hypothetical protein
VEDSFVDLKFKARPPNSLYLGKVHETAATMSSSSCTTTVPNLGIRCGDRIPAPKWRTGRIRSYNQKQERDVNDSESQDDENTKKSKKDVRVSCEAIPEEIAGMG